MSNIKGTDSGLIEKSTGRKIESPLDISVNKICKNCREWDSTDEKIGECIKLDKDMGLNESCSYYAPDPSRFCGICNSKATDDESCAGIFCNKNDLHYASHWDYEWHEIP